MARLHVWLRGPVRDVPDLLQPVAHALVQAREDIEEAVKGLSDEQLWRAPGPIATIGYHLRHLAGATDRLFTYARGDDLDDSQRVALDAERAMTAASNGPSKEALLTELEHVIDAALSQLATVPLEGLLSQRLVGTAQLPTTVLGCFFHAGEHAARHAGQVVTTAKLLRTD